jgi:L-asparaginase/Glu-tRNA(Gln) amidotransferase subunit D
MADRFSSYADSVSGPATRAVAVVPHDVNALGEIPKALFVGTGGTIAMRGAGGGADQMFKNVPNGTVLPFRAEFVRATGTTAADILALY